MIFGELYLASKDKRSQSIQSETERSQVENYH